jgi:hypothetical protein
MPVCPGNISPGAARGVPYRAERAARYLWAAAAFVRPVAVSRGRLVLRAEAERLAAASAGRAVGGLQGAVPRAGRIGPGHVRGAGHRRRPIGAAQVFRRLVRRGETPQGRGQGRSVPAASAGAGPYPVVCGHVPVAGASAAVADSVGLPAGYSAAGPGPALPDGPGPVDHLAVRGGSAMDRRDRGGPGRHLPRGRGSGPRPAGGGRPGDHPPVCRGRAGRAVAAGVGARDARRVPPAPARREGPRPRRCPASTQARATRVAALAAAPPSPPASGGPTQAADPAGTPRGCQGRGQLGNRTPGRHAGGRRPPRRSQPGRRAAAQPAGALLAHWVSDHRAARQGRGGRDNCNAGR